MTFDIPEWEITQVNKSDHFGAVGNHTGKAGVQVGFGRRTLGHSEHIEYPRCIGALPYDRHHTLSGASSSEPAVPDSGMRPHSGVVGPLAARALFEKVKAAASRLEGIFQLLIIQDGRLPSYQCMDQRRPP